MRELKVEATSAPQEASTRDTILNVAEYQFAVSGYDGASVRDIQRAANANGGAVFYYFGTKQALYEAVFERLVEPLIDERMRRLALCTDPANGAPKLEQVLAAYIEPGLRDGFETPQSRWNFAQIRAQLLQTRHGFMQDMLFKHFARLGKAFLDALVGAMPHLDRRDLQWRYHMMAGALTFTMGGTSRLRLGVMGGEIPSYDPGNTEETFNQMITLMTAMFSAPPVFVPDGALGGLNAPGPGHTENSTNAL